MPNDISIPAAPPVRLHPLQHAQDRLSLSRSSVWKLISDGRLAVVRIGRTVRVTDAAIDDVIAKAGG